MSPPNKWLFFPSPAASASVKLNVDFTLVQLASNRFAGTSPTWSGTDAGSPDNYALHSFIWRERNGTIIFRMAFGGSGDYANRGDWIAANGNTLLASTTKFTREDGTVIQSTNNISISGDSTSTFNTIGFNLQDSSSTTWFSGLVDGDTANIQLDW